MAGAASANRSLCRTSSTAACSGAASARGWGRRGGAEEPGGGLGRRRRYQVARGQPAAAAGPPPPDQRRRAPPRPPRWRPRSSRLARPGRRREGPGEAGSPSGAGRCRWRACSNSAESFPCTSITRWAVARPACRRSFSRRKRASSRSRGSAAGRRRRRGQGPQGPPVALLAPVAQAGGVQPLAAQERPPAPGVQGLVFAEDRQLVGRRVRAHPRPLRDLRLRQRTRRRR